jgi:hypothetical protein
MSKHKVKRFNGEFGSDVQDDATGVDEAVAAQSMRTAAEEEGAKDEKAYSGPIEREVAKPAAKSTPKPAAKPAAKPATKPVTAAKSTPKPAAKPATSSAAGAGRGFINPRNQAEAKDRYGRTDSERAANRAKVMDTVKGGLSSVGSYLSSVFTPSGRAEAKKEGEARWKSKPSGSSTMSEDGSAMKRGGSVKKMASGGMANGGSFRSSANGIAQRGKTRGKMC